MLAHIATIICAIAMTLSLCVEAGSVFGRGELSISAPDTSAHAEAPDS